MKAERIQGRLANLAVARAKLDKRIADGHPKSKLYKARLAEYDKSEKVLNLKAELAALEANDGSEEKAKVSATEVGPAAAKKKRS